jgi:hypothetical protein
MASWFKDKDFQVPLLSFICRDRNFLKRCGGMLQPKDFKPGRDESDERWIVATIALEYWKKYRAPISGMLKPDIIEFCRKNNVESKRKKLLLKLVENINNGERLHAVEAMEDRVVEYLRSKKMKDSIEKLLEKQESGELDNDTFVAICHEVIEWNGKSKHDIVSYLDEDQLEQRIARRTLSDRGKRPLLMLEGFDRKSRGPGRGDVAMFLAMYKKGKSLGLAHIADAYAKQNLKVLYITLEDSKDEVEDRMDAATAYIPIHKLNALPNKLRKRFRKFSKRIAGQIRIIDGTEESFTVADIENIWERLRDQGWTADAIIIDYDDEIKASRQHKGESARRQELADVYRELRKFAARRSVIIWTAAQARRMPDNTKIVTADKVAEDISKIRKVSLVIGIGQGEAHDDARYLYVAAQKRGKSRFGWEIMSNPDYGLFYDAERTQQYIVNGKKHTRVEDISDYRKKKRKVAA